MPPKENIFGLDALKTETVAPINDVKVRQPLDNSSNISRMDRGMTALTNSMSNLAVKEQANTIHNDIITAEYYASVDKEMEGFWEPEAQFRYSVAVDRKTKATTMQSMQDFLLLEGSDLLSDDTVDHKTRITSFKNGLLGLLNTGKQSISIHNNAEMFGDMDAMFGKVMSKANVFIAKDKKQEVLATTAASFKELFKDHLNFMEELIPRVRQLDGSMGVGVSDSDGLGNALEPAEYAKRLRKFQAGWTAKHVNSRWFNQAVAEISRTNTGANIKDIKASALTIVGDELLKRVANNPELVSEGMMKDIIANVKGSTKGVTLQDDINAKTDFGIVVDRINTEYKKNLGATLKNLTSATNTASADRDNKIANYVMDNVGTGIKTLEQGLALLKGMNDPSKQRPAETHLRKHFSAESKRGIGHSEFPNLVTYGAKNFYNEDTEQFDTVGFYSHAGENNFSAAAMKIAAEHANPMTKLGERRKSFFDNKAIQGLLKNTESKFKKVLENNNLLKKFSALSEARQELIKNNPVARAEYIKLIGGGDIGGEIDRLLDSQVIIGDLLEDLIKENPNEKISDLVVLARNAVQALLKDAMDGLEFGTTANNMSGKNTKNVDTVAPPVSESKVPLSKLETVQEKLKVKAKLFSPDPKEQKSAMDLAVKELKAFDESKKKLTKLQEVYEGASPTKKAAIIASVGANPENLRVSSTINEIAEIVNPNPEVRRHLAALKLSGQTKILQPMKMEKHDVWNSLVNFLSSIPKSVSKSLSETSRELFWDGQKKTKEIKQNEISPEKPSPNTVVPDGVPPLDITPDVSPIETFSKDFIGKTDTRKGLQKGEFKEPLMKSIAKILRKWKPVSEVNAKELEQTFDKKDHDLVKVLASFESFSPIGEDVGDGEVTIGYGQTKTGAILGQKITSKQAAEDFKKRLYKIEIPQFNTNIKPFLKKQLTPIQRIIVISLIYNVGLDGFKYTSAGQETKAFKALKAGDYTTFKKQAFDEKIGFVKSAGVINKGLVNRRKSEEEMWDK